MIRMLIVGRSIGIRSEPARCKCRHLDLAYRWFCRLDLAGGIAVVLLPLRGATSAAPRRYQRTRWVSFTSALTRNPVLACETDLESRSAPRIPSEARRDKRARSDGDHLHTCASCARSEPRTRNRISCRTGRGHRTPADCHQRRSIRSGPARLPGARPAT